MSDVATVRVRRGAYARLYADAERASEALVWLIDERAEPEAGALEALRGAAAGGPAASLPVDERGAPVEALLGRFAEGDVEALLAGALERHVPLRHTHLMSLLAAREHVLAIDPPDDARLGAYAGDDWTRRLFARFGGVLVPASRVRVAGYASGSPLHALRAARAGGWGRGEALRELGRSARR